jgi:hypothetical protein
MGSTGIALIFAELGVRWGWVISASPRRFCPGKKTAKRYRKLTGHHSRSGRVWRKDIFFSPGVRDPDFPALTELLYGLRYTVTCTDT